MRKVVATGAAALLLLAGCGSDGDDTAGGSGPASTPAPAATSASASPSETASADDEMPVQLEGTVTVHDSADLPDSGEIEMEVDDSYFEPTFVKAKAGAKVTVTLKRDGSLPHTFTIDDVKVDQMLAPETTTTVSFDMPASGHLNFYCKFHRAGGMQGAFYVG